METPQTLLKGFHSDYTVWTDMESNSLFFSSTSHHSEKWMKPTTKETKEKDFLGGGLRPARDIEILENDFDQRYL